MEFGSSSKRMKGHEYKRILLVRVKTFLNQPTSRETDSKVGKQ